MKSVVRRAALIAAGSLALQVALVVALAEMVDSPIAALNTALLLGSTTLLGHIWALRGQVTGDPRAPLYAACLPILACGLFLAPGLIAGTPDALVTLAASTLAAAPTLRGWERWVVPRPALTAWLSRVSATLALSLIVLAIAPGSVSIAAALVAVSLTSVAALVLHRRVRNAARESSLYAVHIDSIEVRSDCLIIPEAPTVRDPHLARVGARLESRSVEIGHEAREDERAEAEIADARQLRTRFMASMSHDLRSPLNSIVGFSQLLETGLDGELGAEQLESVGMIRRSAEELIRLLTDILDLARLEAGKLRLHREWVPSVEILTEVVTRGRQLVAGQDVEIEAQLQPGLPPVYVDPRRTVQAVVALFRHASASLRSTTVRLTARVAQGPPGPAHHLRVEFHDVIGALPQEQVDRIFEAFQEIDEPTGRRVGGLGMALTLSRSLVRLHGGEVWAAIDPGSGTVLSVALPLEHRTV